MDKTKDISLTLDTEIWEWLEKVRGSEICERLNISMDRMIRLIMEREFYRVTKLGIIK